MHLLSFPSIAARAASAAETLLAGHVSGKSSSTHLLCVPGDVGSTIHRSSGQPPTHGVSTGSDRSTVKGRYLGSNFDSAGGLKHEEDVYETFDRMKNPLEREIQ